MLIFLGAEAMFFAGLVSAFLVLRAGMEAWPPPDQPRFPLGVTTLNTILLLASGWTMWRARRARAEAPGPEVARWLGITLALGASFLALQGVEWVRLVAHGLRFVAAVYGGLFAALIGSHALHVAGGVAAVGWAWRRSRLRGALGLDSLTAVALYWTFVVGVWPILFVLVYVW